MKWSTKAHDNIQQIKLSPVKQLLLDLSWNADSHLEYLDVYWESRIKATDSVLDLQMLSGKTQCIYSCYHSPTTQTHTFLYPLMCMWQEHLNVKYRTLICPEQPSQTWSLVIFWTTAAISLTTVRPGPQQMCYHASQNHHQPPTQAPRNLLNPLNLQEQTILMCPFSKEELNALVIFIISPSWFEKCCTLLLRRIAFTNCYNFDAFLFSWPHVWLILRFCCMCSVYGWF